MILKGGSDALNTNKVIVDALGQSLLAYDVPRAALSLIESTDRETTNQFMKDVYKRQCLVLLILRYLHHT